MRPATVLYAILALAVLGAGIVVPYLVHIGGSTAAPGWQSLVAPGPLSEPHRSLAGQCEVCHTPHRGVEAKNCIACHANAPALARQSTAFHMSAKDCRGCHIEHEPGERSTRMDHVVLAALGWQMLAGERPRGADNELLRFLTALGLRDEYHGVLARLDCNSCHSNRDPHRGLFGQACAGCHGVVTWSISGFRHPSANSTDCAQCHQAPPSHYMEHFAMVSQKVAGQEHARVEQCHLCHTIDAWNNIRGVGWYKHH